MKFIIIAVSLFAYGNARNIVDVCDGIIIHNIKHEQQVLKSGINSPYQLAIDYNTNTLFFSYSGEDGNSVFESGYINLKTNEFNTIKGIAGGFANAVDNQNNIVYLGGNDGIYKFDYESKRAIPIPSRDENIWQLFFKNDLYYTIYPEEEAYIFKDNQSTPVPELVGTRAMLVALDKFDNIYFSNSSGLYVHKKAKNNVSFVGMYNLNGFTTDINGELFFSTTNGLYYINDNTNTVDKLTSINNLYGVAIEADGSKIYASENGVIRLKPTKTYCYGNDKINSI